MPTYEYECQLCHERTEAVQKFSDPALTTCPRCGGPLRKVFSSVGIVFKGSGFYKTDSRNTSSSTKSPAPAKAAESTSASAAPAAPAAPAASSSSSTASSSGD